MSDDQKTDDEQKTDDDQKGRNEPQTEVEKRWAEAEKKVQKLEDDPPSDLKEWPDDEAKYVTFGGGEGDHGYDEGPEKNLGPSSVRRHEDGSVEIEGEKVDNPDDYKMESIKGDSDHPADQADDDSGDDDSGEAESGEAESGEAESGADDSGEDDSGDEDDKD